MHIFISQTLNKQEIKHTIALIETFDMISEERRRIDCAESTGKANHHLVKF